MASSGYRKLRGSHLARLYLHKFSNKTCTFKGYKCPQLCIDGFGFCIRHILEDECAPFEQCSFTYPFSVKKCPLAAPKNDYSESFCPEHFNKMQKTRSHAGKAQPPVSTEKLLSNLSHFVKTSKKPRLDKGVKEDNGEEAKTANPFVDINAVAVNSSLSNILDYCSDSDSDVDATVIGRTVRCKDEDSSDAESADSAGEDALKFASVMTVDELILRAKDKTQRLKLLYSDQLRRLTHVLKERRRDYLSNIQKEKESNCSIAEQTKGTPREQKLAEKVKQYNHYRRRYGVEALLRKKMVQKRNFAAESIVPRAGNKCIFTVGGVKCCVRTLPSSRYCPRHILEDPTQVLFRPCGIAQEVDVCREPLPGMESCIYHMDVPPQQITYNTGISSGEEDESKEEIKEESITTANESMEVVTEMDTDLGVKQEVFYQDEPMDGNIFTGEMEVSGSEVVACDVGISVCEEVTTTTE